MHFPKGRHNDGRCARIRTAAVVLQKGSDLAHGLDLELATLALCELSQTLFLQNHFAGGIDGMRRRELLMQAPMFVLRQNARGENPFGFVYARLLQPLRRVPDLGFSRAHLLLI